MKDRPAFIQNWDERLMDVVVISAILVAAFLFRIVVMRFHFAVGWDEPHYLQMSASIAQGKFAQALHPFWSPMYPVCVAFFSFIFHDIEIAGRMVSLVSGILVILPVFFFAKKLYGKGAAYVSAVLIGFHPSLAFLSTSAQSEPTYIFFSLLGMYVGWRAIEKESFRRALSAGILFGFSYLTRPEGIGFWGVYLGVVSIWGIFDCVRHRKFRRIRMAIIIFFGFLFVSSPYFIYLRSETGKWMISSKGFAVQQLDVQEYVDSQVNYSRLSEDNTILPKDAIYHEGNFMRLVGDEKQSTRHVTVAVILRKYAKNIYQLMKEAIHSVFGTVLFLIWAVGFFRSAWQDDTIRLHMYLLFFICFFWFVVVPMFHINERYLIPGFLICFIWMGHGVFHLIQWCESSFGRYFSNALSRFHCITMRRIATTMVFLFIFILFWLPEFGKVAARDSQSTDYWADAVELKKAGQWLKTNVEGSPVIMTPNKAVDFYAGIDDVRRGVTFSGDDFERILVYARHKRVEYMVITERYSSTYKNLVFLFDDTRVPEGFRLVYEDLEVSGIKCRIFHLK